MHRLALAVITGTCAAALLACSNSATEADPTTPPSSSTHPATTPPSSPPATDPTAPVLPALAHQETIPGAKAFVALLHASTQLFVARKVGGIASTIFDAELHIVPRNCRL